MILTLSFATKSRYPSTITTHPTGQRTDSMFVHKTGQGRTLTVHTDQLILQYLQQKESAQSASSPFCN